MEEKLIEKDRDQPTAKKKAYTPPTLIMYGKLTDLTAGNNGTRTEGTGPQDKPPKT